MNTIKKIGFVGIGNMGSPMAGHLVTKGFDVTVYDVRPHLWLRPHTAWTP